jgi:hypothetical protein
MFNTTRNLYLNVDFPNASSVSGYVSETPVTPSFVSGSGKYPVLIAELGYASGATPSGWLLVRKWEDEYAPYNTASGGDSAPYTPVAHPWMIRISGATPSGYYYSVDNGAVYPWSGSLYAVTGIGSTLETSGVSLYLNLSGAGNSAVVSPTPIANDPYITGTWPVQIGSIAFTSGVAVATPYQTLHDYYDIRGRLISPALSNHDNANVDQIVIHRKNGIPSWFGASSSYERFVEFGTTGTLGEFGASTSSSGVPALLTSSGSRFQNTTPGNYSGGQQALTHASGGTTYVWVNLSTCASGV